MYDELLRCLREHAKPWNCADNCICRDAVKRGYGSCSDELAKLAADAIEELSKRVPPVPHGRLIDADAFEEFIRKDWDKHDHWIADIVYSRPTVIPAEEDTP